MIKTIKNYIKKRKRRKQLNKEIEHLGVALKHALIRGDLQLYNEIKDLLLYSIKELNSLN